ALANRQLQNAQRELLFYIANNEGEIIQTLA
ncbi:unnamed protein product, partial [marine sediment metagenome]